MSRVDSLVIRDLTDLVSESFDVDELFTNDEIKDYVVLNYCPDDVFSEDELRQWALENGFEEIE